MEEDGMSKIAEHSKDTRTRFQKFASNVLLAGQIPKHVAFIMDGNRRYSKRNCISISEGYKKGAEKLRDAVKWCYTFGVKEVTAYAFSIENFRRPKHEREHIFSTTKKILEGLIENASENDTGIAVRIVGDWTYIPDDLKKIMAEVMLRSKHNNRMVLNIAFAYTSQNEIARASEILRTGVSAGELKVDDITQELLTDVLQVFPTNPVDILIRTSDTHRLSDFLLWQTTASIIWFIKHDWPELTFWDVWKSIFEFQHCRNYSQNFKLTSTVVNRNKISVRGYKRREIFLEKLRKEAWEKLETFSNI